MLLLLNSKGYAANYTSGAEQYREYAAMRDALNATGQCLTTLSLL